MIKTVMCKSHLTTYHLWTGVGSSVPQERKPRSQLHGKFAKASPQAEENNGPKALEQKGKCLKYGARNYNESRPPSLTSA